jgi:putative transcriptional regulator
MMPQSLAPGLLVAMPQLGDPNFERTVVLMIDHGERGSLGLVINRPTELSLADVVGSMGIAWAGDPDAEVWSGGPVDPNTGWLLQGSEGGDEREDVLPLAEGILLSTSPDELRRVAERPPRFVRFLMGYAGWDSQQLESELAAGAWLLAPVSHHLVFGTAPELMWEATIRSLGIDPSSLVPASGVH